MTRCPIFIGALVTSMLAAAASAQPFYRIFHTTDTPLPGAPVGSFDGVDRDGNDLYFRASGTDGSLEILRRGPAGFSLVASTSTPLPGIGAVDYGFREPSAANGAVATIGWNASGSIDAILLQDASGWHQILNNTTINPLTGAPFMLSSPPAVYDGERFLFQLFTGPIFEVQAGQVTLIAAANHVLPGTSITPAYVSALITPRLYGGAAYFVAGTSANSNTLWKSINGTTTPVLGAGDQTPSGQVTKVLSFAVHGDDAVVLATCQHSPAPIDAILLVHPTGVTTVIDESFPIGLDRLSLAFLNYGMTLDDQVMAFNATIGTGAGSEGFLPVLYAARADGSNLHIVIQAGDALDGRTVGTVRVYTESAQNGEIIFAVKFTDGTRGLYSTAPLVTCGSADFNHDGDTGTDADIDAFFACLAGNCCPACDSADFNGDGDIGTDADIDSFFRVLGGGPC